MPWYAPWSDSIKKRACRYLLQRYLGQFLEEKLTLDQLSVDLYDGTGVVERLALDCQALNELGESQGWPFEIVDGYVQEVNVSIPWATILKDDSFVRVNGLKITVQPKQRAENATSMFESMWSSMTSSMQLAAECLKQEGENQAAPQPVEGIERFAQTIDSILCRVKVRFSNTTIRIEHVPVDSKTGVALEVNIKNIDYLDEAGSDPPLELSSNEKNKTYMVSTFTVKRVSFEGVTFYTDEFPSVARTFSRSVIETNQSVYNKSGDDQYFSSEEDKVQDDYNKCDNSEQRRNNNPMSNPIPFARLSGKQEMRLKMKQSEEAEGPKVDFHLTLGSFTSILSPRQFHILYELVNGLLSPHLEDNSNVPLRGAMCMESKPMQKQDFDKVEAQLTGELASLTGEHGISYLLTKNKWSTANIDDSDQEDEKFLPLASRHDKLMTDSFASTGSMTSSMTSLASSSVSNIPPNGRGGSPHGSRRKKIPVVDGDPNAETSHIHIRMSSCAIVLLHEDILTLTASNDNECLSPSSVDQMKTISDTFFTKLGSFLMSGFGSKDLEKANKAFDSALNYNHLRLIAAPLVLEGNEKTNLQGQYIYGTLTMAKMDIRECLYTAVHNSEKLEVVHILKFDPESKVFLSEDMHKSIYANELSKAPNVKVSFNNSQKFVKIAGERKLAYPRTEIKAHLDHCTVEVDISIIDRMSSVLYSEPICQKNDFYSRNTFYAKEMCSEKSKALLDFCTEIKITCPMLHLKLRFPVADLRPVHDMSRLPWWQRNVRDDYLLFKLREATITNVSTHIQVSTDVKIQTKQIDAYYLKTDKDQEVHLARSNVDELETNLSNCIWPSITISVISASHFQDNVLDSSSDGEVGDPLKQSYYIQAKGGKNSMAHSSLFMDKLSATNSVMNDQPGPFSSKKMVHESDTPHSKDNDEEIEELIVPGDSEELKKFVGYSMKNSLIQISCNLPIVSLQLPSKLLYEVIYNRINSDLLLWEPSAPKAYKPHDIAMSMNADAFGKSMKDSTYQIFSKCKSNTNYNSDSDSSSSSTDSNVYYSVYDQKSKQFAKTKNVQTAIKGDKCGKVNNICFHLQIGKGQMTMYTPVRDNANLVLPVQQGEIVILVKNLSLCHVGGVGGNLRRGLVSLQASHADVYHCGLIPMPSENNPLRIYGCSLPSHLKHTMYPSDKSVTIRNHNNDKEILSIAISIKPNKDYIGFKTIKVAAGISNVTLYHIMTVSQHTWLNQIMDMFDVLDYPIPGYEPSTVITELHVHLWDCAIDYRPLHIPLHAVVTLGSFSISSNVVAQTNASNLRFIAEECALFLSDEVKSDKNINLRKDFVCVIDLGLFELSLRLNDKSSSSAPRVDLRASNNVVHIRTCSDSFKSLCKLIKYLANDGDFNDADFDATSDAGGTLYSQGERDTSPSRENDLLGVSDRTVEDIRELSKSQVQHVNDMMAEAMIENLDKEDKDKSAEGVVEEGVEIFYFPDESNLSKQLNLIEQCGGKDSKNSSEIDLSNMNFQECINVEPNKAKCDDVEVAGEASTVLETPISIVTKDLGDFNIAVGNKLENAKPRTKSSGDNTDDEFCILGEDFTAIKRCTVEPVIRWLTDEPVHIIDNHFTVPIGKTDLLKPPKNFPMAILRYTLCEMTLIWHMYGGNDYKLPMSEGNEGKGMTNNNKKTVTINESRHSPSSSYRDSYNILPKTPSASALYGSQRNIYYQGMGYNKGSDSVTQIPSKDRTPGSPREIPWRHRGGVGRRQDVLMELQLNKVRFQHETYPNNGTEASRQVLIISSVEIRDRLASSQINKFLYQYTSDTRPKQKHANMVVIKAVHLRPDPKLSAQECCLKVSILPLRFNIDQDALLFLIGFFNQFGESDPVKENLINSNNSGSNQSLHSIGGSSRHSTPTHQPPIMSVNTGQTGSNKSMGLSSRRTSNASKTGVDLDNVMVNSDCASEDAQSIKEEEDDNFIDSYEAERLVSENLILLEEDMKLHVYNKASSVKSDSNTSKTQCIETDDSPVYFRSVVFSPDVPIRLDYQGKRVDMTHGPLAGLLMGLAQLNCSELRLKSLSYRHGLLGFERLFKWVMQEWLSDIKRRQLPGLLGGVGPMHSLVQLFQGIRDLFWLPIEQYQRDGRLVRGLQRGASSFTTSTAMAALDITARIIHLIQATAETAYDMVSPSPGLRGSRGKRRRRHDRSRQPQDIREGITNAYHLVKEGLGETAQALADVATSERAARGYSGAVGGVLRQLPPTAIAPVLLASEAAVGFLGGVRATLAPADHKDHRDKWRAPPDSNDHIDSDN